MKKGYGTSQAICANCRQDLEKAPARWDGDDTFVGYLPCPRHLCAAVAFRVLTTEELQQNGGEKT